MNPLAGHDVTNILQRSLSVLEANQKFLANNIANVETPGYRARELDFQASLRAALEGRGQSLRTARPRHMDHTQPRPVLDEQVYGAKNDGNQVDIDEQMAKLSENTGRFTTYSALLRKRFELMRSTLSALDR